MSILLASKKTIFNRLNFNRTRVLPGRGGYDPVGSVFALSAIGADNRNTGRTWDRLRRNPLPAGVFPLTGRRWTCMNERSFIFFVDRLNRAERETPTKKWNPR
jgi:hypothetical protein